MTAVALRQLSDCFSIQAREQYERQHYSHHFSSSFLRREFEVNAPISHPSELFTPFTG
jgi:hypothetical protein